MKDKKHLEEKQVKMKQRVSSKKEKGGDYFTEAERIFCRKLRSALYNHRMSIQEFLGLIIAQNNKCLVCTKEFTAQRKPQIDHNHKTGFVRGLLCFKCNIAAGNVEDSPDIAHRLALYLEVALTREPVQLLTNLRVTSKLSS